MKYCYFDASTGLSGDMILGALLDLGVSSSLFKEKMNQLGLPVEIKIKETKRASLRGLKVDVLVKRKKTEARKWTDIEALLKVSPFSPPVKKNALAIFKNLFRAEAKVHGNKFSQTHLHEIGADDAVIDILGSCFLAEVLKISEFYSSPLNLGTGWTKSSHGVLPVPPPATAELLKNIPVYSAWVKEELVTPTGAAIVSTLVNEFIPFPEISYQKIGYGAGSKDFHNIANILRVFYGKKEEFKVEKKVYAIEANIDDSNPQLLASFFDKAMKSGALDVFFTPVLMKKNRLATKLTVLAATDKIDFLIRTIFKETSSIGVRYYPVERRVLEREIKKVKILGEDIGIKISYLEGEVVNVQPEFLDCLKLAKKREQPVKEITQLALTEYLKRLK
jgi:uncharacterized protein (TIGR00299 family) protein